MSFAFDFESGVAMCERTDSMQPMQTRIPLPWNCARLHGLISRERRDVDLDYFLLFNFNYFDAKRKREPPISDVQMREPIHLSSFRLSTAICHEIHRAEEAHRTVTSEWQIEWLTEHQL